MQYKPEKYVIMKRGRLKNMSMIIVWFSCRCFKRIRFYYGESVYAMKELKSTSI